MASVDFLQKPFELARSSQHVIERLVEISQENARLYAPVTSAFSSFAVLYDFIVYEAGIRVAIQDFALARFELLFPVYSKIKVKMAPETEPPPSWFGGPAVSLLFNISLVQTALPRPEKVSLAKEEPLFLTLQKPETPEVLQEAVQRAAGEPEHETLVNRVIMLQTELASELSSRLEAVSSAFLESQKQAMRIASVAPASKSVLLKKTVLPDESVGGKVEAPHIAVPEEKMGRVSIPKVALEATKEEPPKTTLFSTPPSPAVGVKVAPELPELMAYVYRLPTLILEGQKPAATMTAFAASTTASTSQIEPLTDTSTAPKFTPSISLKKTALPSTSWIAQILLPVLESLRDLSAFPVTGLTTRRLLADTLTQRIPSPEALQTSMDAVTAKSRASRGTDMKADEREIEAIRLPFILATVLSSYLRKSPTTFAEFSVRKPFMKQEYAVERTRKRQLYPEQAGSEQPHVASEQIEAEIFSKLQISRALATAEKMLEEKLKYEPASFIEELQKATAMYGREMSDLAATGPVRATMLDELAPGVLVPPVVEQYLPEESASSEVSETPAFLSQPTTSTQLTHVFPEEESINVNVFTETADEDLRELERKVGRILSEQLANSGTVGSFSAAGLSALDSQAIPSSLLRQVNVREGTINLKVFTEAADEDLRDLERKIRRILTAQISRYYGSSRP